jgi:hypothetical protein
MKSGEGKGAHVQLASPTPHETQIKKNKIPIGDNPLKQEGREKRTTPDVLDTT